MNITADDMRLVRAHLDLTQAEMAQHLGISPRTVVNWETHGVPESKVARTLKIIGRALDDARQAEQIIAEMAAQEGPSDEEYAKWVERNIEPIPEPLGMTTDQRRAYLLQAFTDVDLTNELKARALRRGDRASVWNAARMERYQRFVAPTWEDPDYSNMSEQDARDYGLAAKEADPHIGHDELPHEP